jgi:hypothetical protein
MGSKYSKSNTEDIKEQAKFLKMQLNNKNYKCEADDISLNLQTKDNTDTSSITTASEIFKISQIKNDFVPFTFEWKGSCSNVVLTGSFLNNWTTFVALQKNEKTGIFQKTFLLPRTKHQFKFIVDNNWACSDQYPTIPNEFKGLNNFIDLTNTKPPEKTQKEGNNDNNLNNNIIKKEKSNIILKKQKKAYDSKWPKISELNTYAPCIMQHYIPRFDIEYQSRQDFIGINLKELEFKVRNFNTENNTSKKIMVWPHEKLFHVCPNVKDLSEESENYFRSCTTIRNKHKYLTVVYYKPK